MKLVQVNVPILNLNFSFLILIIAILLGVINRDFGSTQPSLDYDNFSM